MHNMYCTEIYSILNKKLNFYYELLTLNNTLNFFYIKKLKISKEQEGYCE